MTAQVDFFCSAREEGDVLRYLSETGDVVAFTHGAHRKAPLPLIDLTHPPPWPEPFVVSLWLRSAGPLRWLEAKPAVRGDTHGALVNRLFAAQLWDSIAPSDGQAMLDLEASPVLVYRRSPLRDDRLGPALLIAKASNLERVSPEFAKWARRCLAWVRRRSTRIHDSRHDHPCLPNPDHLAGSFYAFPDAAAELASGDHRFALFVT